MTTLFAAINTATLLPYSDVQVGDVVMDYGTWFEVTSEPRSWTVGKDTTVWAFDTAAISQPGSALRGFVNEPGDEWGYQLREDLARVHVFARLGKAA
jgi:hypothetical protein